MNIAIVNLITRTSLCRKMIPEIRSNKDAMIVKFTAQLNALGVEADLFVSDAYKPVQEEVLDIKINYLRTSLQKIFPPSRLPLTPSLFGKLKDNYDVVVCSEAFQWSTAIAVLAKLCSFRRKMKIIVWQELARHQKLLNGWPSVIFHRCILKFFLDPFISCYIPRGELAANFLKSQGISIQKISDPVPHGYDHQVFFSDPGVKKERYLFSPSRLVFSKGIDILLKAFALVCQEVDDLELIIQGEGPLREEYEALSRELNVHNRVRFDSNRLSHDQMRQRYQKALLTVISSREDMVIFSAMESIACGTPVVLSTGIDSHVHYRDGKGGAYFTNGDHRELAGIITGVVKNESMRRRMEDEALRKSNQFQNAYVSKRFLEIIREAS